MIPWLIALAVLAVLLTFFVLLPLRGRTAEIRVRTPQDELQNELDLLYTQIRQLEQQHTNSEVTTADYERFRLRDEIRAAKLLERIEKTPKIVALQKPPATLGSGFIWFVGIFVVLGGLSALAVPSLESLALRPAERELFANQKSLIALGAELNTFAQANKDKPQVLFPVDLLMRYADVAWKLEDYTDAEKGYSSVIRQFTDAAQKDKTLKPDAKVVHALSRYGQILFFNGKNDEALQLLQTAAQFKNAEAYLTIGNILFSVKNNPQGAIKAWETFQKLNTDKEFGARVPDLIAAAKTRIRAANPAAELFAQNCAACHGAQAQGLVGPNLKTSSKAKDAEFVKLQLANGSRNQQMPAFKKIQGKALEQLIVYVTNLKP